MRGFNEEICSSGVRCQREKNEEKKKCAAVGRCEISRGKKEK